MSQNPEIPGSNEPIFNLPASQFLERIEDIRSKEAPSEEHSQSAELRERNKIQREKIKTLILQKGSRLPDYEGNTDDILSPNTLAGRGLERALDWIMGKYEDSIFERIASIESDINEVLEFVITMYRRDYFAQTIMQKDTSIVMIASVDETSRQATMQECAFTEEQRNFLGFNSWEEGLMYIMDEQGQVLQSTSYKMITEGIEAALKPKVEAVANIARSKNLPQPIIERILATATTEAKKGADNYVLICKIIKSIRAKMSTSSHDEIEREIYTTMARLGIEYSQDSIVDFDEILAIENGITDQLPVESSQEYIESTIKPRISDIINMNNINRFIQNYIVDFNQPYK